MIPRPSLLRFFVFTLACVAGLSGGARADAEEGSSPRLYAVEEPGDRESLVTDLIEAAAGDSSVVGPESRLMLLIENAEEGEPPRVLVDGTETLRLPDSSAGRWQAWAQKQSPRRLGDDAGAVRSAPVTSLWHHLYESRDSLLRWTLWPTGLTVEVKSLMNALPQTKITAERRLSFTWAQSVFTYGFAEFGVHRSQWGGGVTRYLRTGDIDFFTGLETPPPYWDDSDWWWHFAVGGPALQYEMRSQGGIAPPYLIFDRGAVTQAKRATDGPILNWFDDKSHAGNVSHAVNLRFGHLRYSFIVDGDAYQVPIMRLALEDLPYGFGCFHFGIWSAADVFMTQVGMDIQTTALIVPVPEHWASTLSILPIRVDFLYRDKKQFQFSLTTRFNLDNPLFQLPGGRP